VDAPQQPPERQGGVHVPRRGPGAPQGRLQRPPARGPAARLAAGLDLARAAADVAIPGDDLDRAGLAEQGTYRRRSLLGDDRRPRGQGRGAGAAQAGARDAFLLAALRPVSVHLDGGDRRPRPPGRLRARNADPSDLRPRARRAGPRPRDSPPVVRQLGHPQALVGDLAQRGLRDLVGVDLVRAPRGPQRQAGLPRADGAPGEDAGSLEPAAGTRGGPAPALLALDLGGRAFGCYAAPTHPDQGSPEVSMRRGRRGATGIAHPVLHVCP
jgi:hypothetical protein